MGCLRLLLAYIVLISHCPPGIFSKISHPALAVQCFYVISGFYMQMVVNQFKQPTAPWILNFYKNRIIRIFPCYLIFLTLTAIFLPDSLDYLHESDWLNKSLFLINNITLIPQSIVKFFPIHMNMMGQSWTLSLELMFYIFAPYLLTKNIRILLFVIAASILGRFILVSQNLYLNSWAYGFFPIEIGTFLAGSLGYRFYKSYLHSKAGKVGKGFEVAGLCILLYLVFFMIEGWHQINGGEWNGKVACGFPYKYWAVLLLTIFSIPFIFKFSKKIKIDRLIGELSYPLYIGHFFMIDLLTEKISTLYIGSAVFSIMLVISIPIIYFIEMPLQKLRDKLRSKNFVNCTLSSSQEHSPEFLKLTSVLSPKKQVLS